MKKALIFILFLAVIISCDPLKKSQRETKKEENTGRTNTSGTVEIYISTYKAMAVREMNRTGIPASITLAQGILESGNGLSQLARQGNNHFGIKCGGSWNGGTIYMDDDAKNECFRTYKDPDESYRDHSDYLMKNKRYASLFNLDKTDYKSWATGLKQAGYATRGNYAEILIGIIEKYKLYELDKGGDPGPVSNTENSQVMGSSNPASVNGIPVVIVKQGDSWESIASSSGTDLQKLLKYNEASLKDPLSEGSYVYLKSKKYKARESYHIFRLGESIHNISQLYGVKADRINRMNNIPKGRVPAIGEILFLRQQRSSETKTISENEYQLLLAQNITQTKKPQDSVKKEDKPIITTDTSIQSKPEQEEVVVPANNQKVNDKPDTETKNETVIPQKSEASTAVYHIVVKGETLYSIARKYSTSTAELIRINNLSGSSVSIGETIYIKKPVEAVNIQTAKTQDNPAKTVTPANLYDTTWHIVKAAEDLSMISNQYNVSIFDIINFNKMDVYDLTKGQKLIVQIVDKTSGKNLMKPLEAQQININQKKQAPKQEEPAVKTVDKEPVKSNDKTEVVEENTDTKADSPTEKFHIVKPGETLYRISVNHKKTVEQLKKYNGLKDNSIKVGQKLIINP